MTAAAAPPRHPSHAEGCPALRPTTRSAGALPTPLGRTGAVQSRSGLRAPALSPRRASRPSGPGRRCLRRWPGSQRASPRGRCQSLPRTPSAAPARRSARVDNPPRSPSRCRQGGRRGARAPRRGSWLGTRLTLASAASSLRLHRLEEGLRAPSGVVADLELRLLLRFLKVQALDGSNRRKDVVAAQASERGSHGPAILWIRFVGSVSFGNTRSCRRRRRTSQEKVDPLRRCPPGRAKGADRSRTRARCCRSPRWRPPTPPPRANVARRFRAGSRCHPGLTRVSNVLCSSRREPSEDRTLLHAGRRQVRSRAPLSTTDPSSLARSSSTTLPTAAACWAARRSTWPGICAGSARTPW